jgi:hypothetical protein
VRLLARAAAVIGAVTLGAYLFSAAPRDVVLVYDVPAPGEPAVLEIELRRAGELVRRAELSVPAGGGQVRHPVRLPDGLYALGWKLSGRGASAGEIPVEVREDATVVLALRGRGTPPETPRQGGSSHDRAR